MKKMLLIGILTIAVLITANNIAVATDPPHSDANNVQCNGCHMIHQAAGPSLTNNASNANLCLSCHTSGGTATTKPLSVSMQATPGASGTSHRWDAAMPASDNPDNQYGLRPTANLASAVLKAKLTALNNVITCSVCHNQHNQANSPWDSAAPAYTGAGTGSGRHFQRIADDINQLCEDCHYYRAMSYTKAKGEDGSYVADGTKTFSHPVGETLNLQGYDKGAPLDYDGGSQQTAPRYHANSAGDTNTTNNLVLDSSTKVRCLSCHRVHYVDSNGTTVDTP